MISDFFHGARSLVRGYSLLLKPGLRRYVIVPLGLNILVFAALIWAGAYGASAAMAAWFPADGGWAGWMRVLLWIMFGGIVLIFVYVSFTIVANLVGAPFNGPLARAAEKYLGGASAITGTDISMPRAAIAAVIGEWKKLAYFAPFIALALLLTLVPIINLFAPLVWAWVAARMAAIEYLGYPMENHGCGFAEIRQGVNEKKSLSLGFGFAVAVATMIPFANFLVMPAAVIGATALWVDRWGGAKDASHDRLR